MFDGFLPYQKRWLNDESQVKVWEKSRRIGASWCEASDAILNAALGFGNVYYIGFEKEMTRQFIDDARVFAKDYQNKVHPATIQDDPDKDNLIFEIRTSSGKSIRSVTSTSKAFRSKGAPGDIFIIDEAAFVKDLKGLLAAALPVLVWGGKLRILSTHDGDENPFNELIQDIRKGKLKYSLHRTTLDDALDQGLYKTICGVKGEEWNADKQTAWREDLIAAAGSAAEEEFFCVPSRGDGAWLSGALIEARQKDFCKTISWKAPVQEFSLWSDNARSMELNLFVRSQIWPVLDEQNGRGVIGVDFARSSDLSVFAILRLQSDMKRFCTLIELRNIPFQQQEQLFRQISERLHKTSGFGGAKLDARGNGHYLAERAQQQWGASAVEAVQLTEKWYLENMPKLKAAFDDDDIVIPKDEGIYSDLRSVVLIRGVPRVPDIRVKDGEGEKRHGDAAIALALAWAASLKPHGPIEFQELRGDPEKRFQENLEQFGV